MLTPTQRIWHNGRFIPWEQATIHVLSHVVSYGTSVFEGIRCYATPAGPAIFRLRDHVRRLADSAKIYRMDLGYTREELAEAMQELVRVNDMESCYIRPIAIRAYGDMGVNPLNNPVDVYLACWLWGKYLGEEALAGGVDVCVSSWKRIAPNTLPALAKAGANYMNSQLIKMEAITNGYTEGIALDEAGYVSEGSGENIFLVRDGRLHTPPLGASVLPGVTRDSVLRLAHDSGHPGGRNHHPARDALYRRRGFLYRHRRRDHAHSLHRPHPGRQRPSRPHHGKVAKGVLRGNRRRGARPLWMAVAGTRATAGGR
jgi:branched-chain amino acid aminotransferase